MLLNDFGLIKTELSQKVQTYSRQLVTEGVEDVRRIALSSVATWSSIERALFSSGCFLLGACLSVHAAVLRGFPAQTEHIHLRGCCCPILSLL